MPTHQYAATLTCEVLSHWTCEALAQRAAYDAIASFFS